MKGQRTAASWPCVSTVEAAADRSAVDQSVPWDRSQERHEKQVYSIPKLSTVFMLSNWQVPWSTSSVGLTRA